MTITVSNTTNTQSCGTWLERTNQIAQIISSNALTADASSSGSVTTGNAVVNGFFSANTLVITDSLRGGTLASPAAINISSNAAFVNGSLQIYANSLSTNVIIGSNASFSANVSITGNLSVIGATNFSNTTSHFGAAAFSNTITVTGNTTLTGAVVMSNTVSATGAVSFNSTLAVAGNTTLTGTVAMSNTITVAGNTTLTGAVIMSNTVSATGAVSFNNTLAVTGVTTLSANANISGKLTVSNTSTFSGNTTFDTSALQVLVQKDLIVSGNLTVSGTTISSGNTTALGSIIPSTDAIYSIGNTTNRFTLFSTNTNVSNTFIIGTVHSSSNSYTFTGPSTTIQTVDAFAIATYRSVEYLVQTSNATTFQISKMLGIHDGTNAYITEYGIINNGVSTGVFSASITAGSFNLRLTPTSNTITAKIFRSAITV